MKIIMMGSGPFAVPTFRLLAQQKKHEVILLISQPHREIKGRLQPDSPTVTAAKELGIPVWLPDKVNNHIEQLRSYEADLLVVCDYGQILSPDALGSAVHGGLNLHGSLLPKYRGAAPINWAILQGETRLGVTVIHLTPQLDAGPIVAQASLELGECETAEEVEPRLAQLGAPLTLKVVDDLESGQFISEIQIEGAATRAPKLKKTDGKIDWNASAVQIRRQYQALQPWPGTHFIWVRNGKELRLMPCSVPEIASSDAVSAAPGTVLDVSEKLIIQTGDGAIALSKIQPAGKNEMDIKSFAMGYQIKPGNRME